MHRVAISQSFRLRKDSIFFSLLFFPLSPPFFTQSLYAQVHRRGGKKKERRSLLFDLAEKKREKSGIDAVSFRENRKVRSKSPY